MITNNFIKRHNGPRQAETGDYLVDGTSPQAMRTDWRRGVREFTGLSDYPVHTGSRQALTFTVAAQVEE